MPSKSSKTSKQSTSGRKSTASPRKDKEKLSVGKDQVKVRVGRQIKVVNKKDIGRAMVEGKEVRVHHGDIVKAVKKSKRTETANVVRFLHKDSNNIGGKTEGFQVSSEAVDCMKAMKDSLYGSFTERLSEMMRLSKRGRVASSSEAHTSDVSLCFQLMLQAGDFRDDLCEKIRKAGLSYNSDTSGGVRSFELSFQPGFAREALNVGKGIQVASACTVELLTGIEVILSKIRDIAFEKRRLVLVGRGLTAEYLDDDKTKKSLAPTHFSQAIADIPELKGLFMGVRFPHATRLLTAEILAASNAKKPKNPRNGNDSDNNSVSSRSSAGSRGSKKSTGKRKATAKKTTTSRGSKKSTAKKSGGKKTTSRGSKKSTAGRKRK